MSFISIIHPSRSRPQKSHATFVKWMSACRLANVEFILSLDSDDNTFEGYAEAYGLFRDPIPFINLRVCHNNNRSAVDAINNGANIAIGDIFIVVSDDTECFPNWDVALLKEVEGEVDWILKTQDGIQPYIITMPVMDRAYYNRTGNIYDPGFDHMFCDTYMTCVADITGRKLTSDLVFPHDNPGHYGKPIDDINRKNDATWSQGEETFIRLMKQFSKEDLQKIKDRQMVRWLRNKGVQV